jgi:hypothetical protein
VRLKVKNSEDHRVERSRLSVSNVSEVGFKKLNQDWSQRV